METIQVKIRETLFRTRVYCILHAEMALKQILELDQVYRDLKWRFVRHTHIHKMIKQSTKIANQNPTPIHILKKMLNYRINEIGSRL